MGESCVKPDPKTHRSFLLKALENTKTKETSRFSERRSENLEVSFVFVWGEAPRVLLSAWENWEDVR
jgi:hypothetical protein